MKMILLCLLILWASSVFLPAQYSGGNGRGDAAATITNILLPVQENQTGLPEEYNLAQNYPNPLNPITKIQYSIPCRSKVVIKIFNILGNEVQTLLAQEKTAGIYEIIWYADNFPSGVYYYQLTAASGGLETFSETKKMLLLK